MRDASALLISCALLGLLAASPVHAQESLPSPFAEYFRLSAGLLSASSETELRLDADDGTPGTVVSGEDDLENLGLRDWLGEPRSVVLIEWPERAPILLRQCDLLVELVVTGATTRRVTVRAKTTAGAAVLTPLVERSLNNPQ